MAMLPEQDGTISRIYKHYEDNQEAPHRWHLGASLIGRECSRELFYTFRWCTTERHEGRLLRLFETGQLAESRFVANLRAIGVKVEEVDPITGKQFRISDFGGHFGGSLDGIGKGFIEAPRTEHVIEMKTHGEKSFKELIAKLVKTAKPEHWVQMNTYMGYKELTRAYYLAVNKNTDELHGERVKFDAKEFEKTRNKALQIITSDRPLEKISQDSSWYKCKFCTHHSLCHGTARPEVNCRTCSFSTPVIEGTAATWHCGKYDCNVDETTMRQSHDCPSHLFIPPLLENWATPIDAGEDFVVYRNNSNEQVFINGSEADKQEEMGATCYTSKEIKAAADIRFIGTEAANEMKQAFQAEVIG